MAIFDTPASLCAALAENGDDRCSFAGTDLAVWNAARSAHDATDPGLPEAERWRLAALALEAGG